MSKFLSLNEAAAWLAVKLGEPVTEDEIIRTAVEHGLPVCFHFRGRVWRDDKNHHDFDGLLQSSHPPRLNTKIERVQFRKGTAVTSRYSCEHTLQVRAATPVVVFLCTPPFPNESLLPVIGLGASTRRLHPGRSVQRADWLFSAEKLLAILTQDHLALPTASTSEQSVSIEPTPNAEQVPGKMPRVAVGKLAVKAAWEIELETKRAASVREVMKRLQSWADEGKEPEYLIRSDPKKRCVFWRTVNGEEKDYGEDACAKTIKLWMESRH